MGVDKGKIVAILSQRQIQDADRVRQSDFTVRRWLRRGLIHLSPTSTHDELLNSSLGVARAVWRLRGKSFIHMFVAVEHDLGLGLVEQLPPALDL